MLTNNDNQNITASTAVISAQIKNNGVYTITKNDGMYAAIISRDYYANPTTDIYFAPPLNYISEENDIKVITESENRHIKQYNDGEIYEYQLFKNVYNEVYGIYNMEYIGEDSSIYGIEEVMERININFNKMEV